MAVLTIWDVADECGNLRARDVARLIGVDRQTVYKYVECGVLPCRRLPGGYMVFRAEDVARLVEPEPR